jgi:hypothetical protein
MKKLFLMAVMALAFSSTVIRADVPLPECNPCPWVR